MYLNEGGADLVVGTCEKCRIVTTMFEEDEGTRCEKCSDFSVSRTSAIYDESMRGWGPVEVAYQCPVCSAMSAVSEIRGLWD